MTQSTSRILLSLFTLLAAILHSPYGISEVSQCEPRLLRFQPSSQVDLGTHQQTLRLSEKQFLKNFAWLGEAAEVRRWLATREGGLSSLERAQAQGLISFVVDVSVAEFETLLARGHVLLPSQPVPRTLKLLTTSQLGATLSASPTHLRLVMNARGLALPGLKPLVDLTPGGRERTDLSVVTEILKNQAKSSWPRIGFAIANQTQLHIADLQAAIVTKIEPTWALRLNKMAKTPAAVLARKWLIRDVSYGWQTPLVVDAAINPLEVYALNPPPSKQDVLAFNFAEHLEMNGNPDRGYAEFSFWLPFAKSTFAVKDVYNSQNFTGRLIDIIFQGKEPGSTAANQPGPFGQVMALVFLDSAGHKHHILLDEIAAFRLVDYVPNGPDGVRLPLSPWQVSEELLEHARRRNQLLVIER